MSIQELGGKTSTTRIKPEVHPVNGAGQVAHQFKSGDWVTVCAPEEIRRTLKPDARTHGLPFMPEMARFCGHTFRVIRAGVSVCHMSRPGQMSRVEDAYLLQTTLRCSGQFHGGCQLACQFFWRAEWLKPAHVEAVKNRVKFPTQKPDLNLESEELQSELALATRFKRESFQCQATALAEVSTPVKVYQLNQYVSEIRRNQLPLPKLLGYFAHIAKNKIASKLTSKSDSKPARTPCIDLDLEIGDRVRVKSIEDIERTLDANGCNRGLWFDPHEMAKFSGRQMWVSRKIERLIDERTGMLRKLSSPTVVLSEAYCSGEGRRFCSRGLFHLWRNIWLEKVAG